jgi:hypothetical protein
MPLSPYYTSFSALAGPVRQNIQILYTTILNGEQWSALFVPKGGAPYAMAALAAIPILGFRTEYRWRAAFVLLLALGILIPCTYVSFLWNRLRYLWPFAPGWFVGAACFARLCGELAANVRARWIAVSPMLSGTLAGLLAMHLGWSIDDLVQSASAIDRQQVALGRWASESLPSEAVIGVNDTGAIAYLSNRKTFDVVGLTTMGEARYWVAGAGSRFEHYEKLVRTQRQRFPTHFIVYPQWMACTPVLGIELHEAAVYDQTILGGTRMIVYPARLDLLGSSDKPHDTQLASALLDELDVADLDSEQEHAYEFWLSGNNELSNRVYDAETSLGRPWAEGARFERTVDRFRTKLPGGKAVRAIALLTGPEKGEARIDVRSNGQTVATLTLDEPNAVEKAFEIPAAQAVSNAALELAAQSGYFGSLHYWFVEL